MTGTPRVAGTPLHAAHKTGTLSPVEQGVLWDREDHFWTGGAEDARAMTAKNAIVILPYPPGIIQGDQLWTYLQQRSDWQSVVMAERRVSRSRDIAILTYRVTAKKEEAPIFKALCSSTYLCDDDTWLRLLHQQTTGA